MGNLEVWGEEELPACVCACLILRCYSHWMGTRRHPCRPCASRPREEEDRVRNVVFMTPATALALQQHPRVFGVASASGFPLRSNFDIGEIATWEESLIECSFTGLDTGTNACISINVTVTHYALPHWQEPPANVCPKRENKHESEPICLPVFPEEWQFG